MFHRFITWLMALLKSIWVNDKIIILPVEPVTDPLPVEPIIETEQEGDPVLEIFHTLLAFKTFSTDLSDDPFDFKLYKNIKSQLGNHGDYLLLLNKVNEYLTNQTKFPDDAFYLDDPKITGLSRGVIMDKELSLFISQGKCRTVKEAFDSILSLTLTVYETYTALKAHPTLSSVKKDYAERNISKVVTLVEDYIHELIKHGKINDSTKETDTA
jgi:hypothetical protein